MVRNTALRLPASVTSATLQAGIDDSYHIISQQQSGVTTLQVNSREKYHITSISDRYHITDQSWWQIPHYGPALVTNTALRAIFSNKYRITGQDQRQIPHYRPASVQNTTCLVISKDKYRITGHCGWLSQITDVFPICEILLRHNHLPIKACLCRPRLDNQT